jgi:hypothetical protein
MKLKSRILYSSFDSRLTIVKRHECGADMYLVLVQMRFLNRTSYFWNARLEEGLIRSLRQLKARHVINARLPNCSSYRATTARMLVDVWPLSFNVRKVLITL